MFGIYFVKYILKCFEFSSIVYGIAFSAIVNTM